MVASRFNASMKRQPVKALPGTLDTWKDEGLMNRETLLPSGVYRFTVSAADAGKRLDQFLAETGADISRGLARKLIELGGVHVDGRRVRRCGLILTNGQQLEYHVDGFPLEPFLLDDTRIIYRDPYLIVLDKPAGVATQPTPARFQGTLYAALLGYLGKSASLGMVQRLDRDTSGVMVFSIHDKAHKGLTEAFREHRVSKRYLALVSGLLEKSSGEIRSQLARRRSTNRMVSVERGGKDAVTCYRLVKQFAEAALVSVEIPTGRTHQIRVHFSELGHPLLGDHDYGGPRSVAGIPVMRQMLHASELALNHPVGGAGLEFRAPLPGDFAALIQHLEQTAKDNAASSGI